MDQIKYQTLIEEEIPHIQNKSPNLTINLQQAEEESNFEEVKIADFDHKSFVSMQGQQGQGQEFQRYFSFDDPLEIKEQKLMNDLMQMNLQRDKLQYIFDNQVNVGSLPYEFAKKKVLEIYFNSKHMVIQKIKKNKQFQQQTSNKSGVSQFLDIVANFMKKIGTSSKKDEVLLTQQQSEQKDNTVRYTQEDEVRTNKASSTTTVAGFHSQSNRLRNYTTHLTVQQNQQQGVNNFQIMGSPMRIHSIPPKGSFTEEVVNQPMKTQMVEISSDCNHVYKYNDMVEYLNYQILYQKNCKIYCPAQDCPTIMSKSTIFQIVSEETINQYNKNQVLQLNSEKQLQQQRSRKQSKYRSANNNNINRSNNKENSWVQTYSQHIRSKQRTKSQAIQPIMADQHEEINQISDDQLSSIFDQNSELQSVDQMNFNNNKVDLGKQIMNCPGCGSKIKRLWTSNKQMCQNCNVDVCWQCRGEVVDHTHYEGLNGCRIFETQPNFVRINDAQNEDLKEKEYQNSEEIIYDQKIKKENLFCLILKYILTCTVFQVHRENLNQRCNVKKIEHQVQKVEKHVKQIKKDITKKNLLSDSENESQNSSIHNNNNHAHQKTTDCTNRGTHCDQEKMKNKMDFHDEELHKIFNIHDCDHNHNHNHQNYYQKYPYCKYLWEFCMGQGLGDNIRTILWSPLILIIGNILILFTGFFFWLILFRYKLGKSILGSLLYSVLLYVLSVVFSLILCFVIAQYILGHNTIEYYEKMYNTIEDNIKEDIQFLNQYQHLYEQYNIDFTLSGEKSHKQSLLETNPNQNQQQQQEQYQSQLHQKIKI